MERHKAFSPNRFRLSPQQERIASLVHQVRGTPFRVDATIVIDGALDRPALYRAVDTVVARHEILRAVFETLDDGTVLQKILPASTPWIWDLDLCGLDDATRATEIERQVQAMRRSPFDLAGGPLLQISLLRLSATRHMLLVALPALCADLATIDRLTAEIARAYDTDGRQNGQPADILQFADLATWQHDVLASDAAEADQRDWRRLALAAPREARLPFDPAAADERDYAPHVLSTTLAPGVAGALRALAGREASLGTVLLAGWRVLLWRLTADSDLVIGMGCDGRLGDELRDALGPMAKSLPFLCQLQNDMTFGAVVERAARIADHCLASQETFDWSCVIDGSESSGGVPYFRLGFDYNPPRDRHRGAGVTFVVEDGKACLDRYDLRLLCEPRGSEIAVRFEYDAALYERADIARLAGYFETLVNSIVDAPDKPIDRLAILPASERARILVEFNDTRADYPSETCVHDQIEERASRCPRDPAVLFADAQLSYGDLDRRSNQLAHYLRRLGVGPDVFVGIHVDPAPEMLVALLGVLKAGGAYVPLDPEYPADRLRFMLEDTAAPVLITQAGLGSIAVAHDMHVLRIDADWSQLAAESDAPLERLAGPDNLAYAIYTSGSTGTPKGVPVTHRNLVHSTHARRLYYGGLVGRYLLLSSFGFDSSVAGIFWTLVDGGALVLPRAGTQRDPKLIGALIRRHRATHSLCLASHWALILSQAEPGGFASLNTSIISGEVFSNALVQKHDEIAPGAGLFNEYGPTEGTVWSAVFDCHDPVKGNKVPMGRPIANTTLYLLDAYLQPVPIGVPGEMYQGGAGVAVGYLNQPELTAERFVPDPFCDQPGARLYRTGDLARFLPDGNIEFLGRVDQQVKLRGYRIELGEIEAVLGKHPAVREVAVICREDRLGDKRLVAYVVSQPGQLASVPELRERVTGTLPVYMMPSAFVALDELPRTSIGKLIADRLPAPGTERQDLGNEIVAPSTPLQKAVGMVWAEVLGLDVIGLHDNFFEAGGNSLLATRIIYRVRDALGVELPIRAIFEHPTVQQLADAIAGASTDPDALAAKAGLVAEVLSMSEHEVDARLDDLRDDPARRTSQTR